jgi:hypothetical protein
MLILADIPTCGGNFYRDWRPSFRQRSPFFGVGYHDTQIFQAATPVGTNQDTLIDLLGRIENFFRRLEVYLEVPPTAGMVEIMVKVMVEVLSILAIATKEVKQSKTSELILGER